jgi:hypothetical protein
MTPDNIVANAPTVIERDGLLAGVINPVSTLTGEGASVCMGILFGASSDWHTPGSAVPDGSYALFRGDNTSVEVLTDAVASRSVWYIKTDDYFIASTSQRAMIILLQSFEKNNEVYSWILTSGTLGPGLSWDQRIRLLPPDSKLTLNREQWRVDTVVEPVNFLASNSAKSGSKVRLTNSITETFSSMKIDTDKWRLPLSGGVDSRAIFFTMLDHLKSVPRTVTFGFKSAQNVERGDAAVAKKLASTFNVPNDYFDKDLSEEPIGVVLDRWLMAGEGRLAEFSPNASLEVWKQLYEGGCEGIIRGDQAFGCRKVKTPDDVVKNMGMMVLDDYHLGSHATKIFENFANKRPPHLEKKSNESMEQWRDRVNSVFEIPTIFAARSDLKLAYIEVIHPLLSKNIMQCVRSLPDDLRTDKSLFKEIVAARFSDITFSTYRAKGKPENILKSKAVVDFVRKELRSYDAEKLFQKELIDYVLERVVVQDIVTGSKGGRSDIVKLFDKGKKKITRVFNKNRKLDFNVVAFRLFVISRMHRILIEDAAFLAKQIA